jgi:proteic killer suppression protein
MLIRNVVHRGLRRFIQRDDASGLPPAVVEKIRNILHFPAGNERYSRAPGHPIMAGTSAVWRPKGDLELDGHPELANHVPDRTKRVIVALDFEDYH